MDVCGECSTEEEVSPLPFAQGITLLNPDNSVYGVEILATLWVLVPDGMQDPLYQIICPG